MAQSNPHLAALEELLRETIKANYCLTLDDLHPESVINEITTQLEANRFEWLDNTIYVPNLLTIDAMGCAPDKLEEIEVLFNSVVFMKYLYEYMTDAGYKLFDFVKIELNAPPGPPQPIKLHFYWPSPEEVREDFTVLLDKQEGKIVEVYAPKAEIAHLARLSALNAETYRVDYVITKQITYLGRLRNVIDRETGYMLRRNDFIFARSPDPNSINSSVSRLHAKIVYEDGIFYLYDTGSANGTSITRNHNSIELPRAEIRGEILEDGDVIHLGTAQISFQFISEEEAANLVSMPPEKVIDEFEATSPVDDTHQVSRQEVQAEIKKLLNEEK